MKILEWFSPAGFVSRRAHPTLISAKHSSPCIERVRWDAEVRCCTLQVIMQLQQQFKIEPCFTQLVWQKLEEQNQEFFRAYYTRLKLKDQIILFNHLLDEQVKMFQRMPRGGQMMPGAFLPVFAKIALRCWW